MSSVLTESVHLNSQLQATVMYLHNSVKIIRIENNLINIVKEQI